MSPYSFKTSEEHYNALLAETKKAGGPTQHTWQTLPKWDGFYVRSGLDDAWIYGSRMQSGTLIPLLTPEYQKRYVQQQYHETVSNSPQWSASFCYPEGLMRWWSQPGPSGVFEVMMNPYQVQFLSGTAGNLMRRFLIGRKHVQEVPQWYGETVGFWNGTTLIAWTANVQGWTLTHNMFEYSNSMEIVEVFRPSADGRTIIWEATFYDPEAFVRPVHAVTTVAGDQLDQAGLPQFGQPGLQDGRRGLVAGGAQRARRQRAVIAQLPDDPQAPAAAEQVEQRHDRPAGRRAGDGAFCLG